MFVFTNFYGNPTLINTDQICEIQLDEETIIISFKDGESEILFDEYDAFRYGYESTKQAFEIMCNQMCRGYNLIDLITSGDYFNQDYEKFIITVKKRSCETALNGQVVYCPDGKYKVKNRNKKYTNWIVVKMAEE